MPYHPHRRLKKHRTPFFSSLVSFVAIASPLMTLPQVYLIYSSRHAIGVSVITWFASVITSGIWFFYGYTHKEKPIIINSALGGFMSVCIVIGVLLYG